MSKKWKFNKENRKKDNSTVFSTLGDLNKNLSKSRKEIISPFMQGHDYNRVVAKIREKIRDSLSGTLTVKQQEELSKNISKILPDHFIHDLFSIYYNDSETLKINSGKNKSKSHLLTKLFDVLMTIVTNDSFLGSFFVTEALGEFFVRYYLESDAATQQALLDMLAGKGGFDSTILSGDKVQQSIQNALNDAQDKIDETEDMIKGIGKEIGDARELDDISEILPQLKSMSFSNKLVDNFLKKILNKSMNYFSKKSFFKEESIFDVDFIDEILDLEYLIEPLFSINVDNINTRQELFLGKFDMYIDCSGSMGRTSYQGSDLAVAKAIAIKLMLMEYVENVYFFDSTLSKRFDGEDIMGIIKYESGGGTNFNNVIKKVISNGKNSIVLTDGQDNADLYTDKLFWVGIKGANFRYFGSGDTKKYITNKQCIIQEGNDFKLATL
jgi:hypothetical protein